MTDKLILESRIFQNIIDTLPLLLFWTDVNNICLGTNLQHAKTFGFSSIEDMIGTTVIDILQHANLSKDLINQVINEHKEVVRSKRGQRFEYTAVMADGKKHTWLSYKEPLLNEDSMVVGLIGVSVDITELNSAKKRAEIASAAKSEFIANMSHDLRTPITGMLGMVQDMLNVANQAASSINDKDSQQTSIALQDIVKTVQRDSGFLMGATDELLQLCNEILEVVSLESGKSEKHDESFDLNDLINHNIELLQPIAQHKKLRLSCDIDQNVPRYLKGARIYLDRILLNLVGNGLKFTEKGEIKICVKWLKGEKDKNVGVSMGQGINLQIQIKDTGIGIPEDKFDDIFEHFSRLAPSYEGLYKGAGLGLYTVKRYVEAMRGAVIVSSEVSKGACFTVTLPFIVSDHAGPSRKSVRFSASMKPDADKTILESQGPVSIKEIMASILVVEDNELAAIAVTLTLKPFNCHIDTAEAGSTAVEMAQKGNYDLILMDIGLPDFSGIEVAKKIRGLADPKKSQVPIVALTGHANNSEMRQEAIEANLQDVLSKPAQPLALESILQKYVFKMKAAKADTLTHPQRQDHEIPAPESNAPKSLEVIDWDASVRMCNGDSEFTYKKLSMLDNDLNNVKKVLAQAYAHRDTKTLRAELHRSRGGVCYLKLPELEQTLKKFHEAVKKEVSQNTDHFKETYVKLQQAIDHFQTTWAKNFK